MLYAHTPNAAGDCHKLEKHLRDVAALAAGFAAQFGAADLARLVGLWHDLGKASDSFQHYLALCAAEPGKRFTGVDHKGAGALAAFEAFEPLAFVVQGHHGGLPDYGALRTRINELRDEPLASLIANAKQRETESGLAQPDLKSASTPILPPFVDSRLKLEMFLRMLFSCLVDADHLDTEAHRNPEKTARRRVPPDVATLLDKLESNQAKSFGKPEDPVDVIRHEVYLACLAAAEQQPGLFRLTVPTGGGKTRSGLAFALRHAERHGLRRVIVVSPYLTITDQTADVFRSVLGEGAILEHHSDAGRNDDPAGVESVEAEWRRLTAQNWDAAIVVTTAVQFFESLFSNRPMACRKLHRIAGSVVILDEPQTLPAPMLDPIADGIRQLVEHYGTTVVLCTATQPALKAVPAFASLPDAFEIAPEPPRLFRELKRVDYEWPGLAETWSWDETADALRSETQVLCVVNTRPDALALLEALSDPETLHLSTLLCGAHRREVLDVIRGRLKEGLPCRVVSTQVVEAGVDLDFPVVFRAMGPLDRIVQAAGRCNREGRLDAGRVVVFKPEAGGIPKGPYRTATDLTGVALAGGAADPNDPETFDRYFRSLYTSVSVDAKAIQDLRTGFAFRKVADEFRMIPDDSASAMVLYKGLPASKRRFIEREVDHVTVIAEIDRDIRRSVDWGAGVATRALMARAQPYLVNLRRRMLEQQMANQATVEVLAPDVWKWGGGYDEIVGIGRMDASVWNAEDFVIA